MRKLKKTQMAETVVKGSMERKKKKIIQTKAEELLHKPGQGARLRYIIKEKKGWNAFTAAMKFFGFQINEIIKASNREEDLLKIKYPRQTPKYDPQIYMEIKRLCKAHGGKEIGEDKYKFDDQEKLDELINTEQKYVKSDFEESYLIVIRRRIYDHFYKKNFKHEGVLDQYTNFIHSLGGNMGWVRRGGPVEFAFRDEIKEKMTQQQSEFKKEKQKLIKQYDNKLAELKNKFYDRLEKKDAKIEELEKMIKEYKDLLKQ